MAVDYNKKYVTQEIVGTPGTFAGLEIAPGNMYFDGENFQIANNIFENSYEQVYGKKAGSFYFNWDECHDATVEKWRVPTKAEWEKIITIDSSIRPGATLVDENWENAHFAYVTLTEKANLRCLLIFPDNVEIEIRDGLLWNSWDEATDWADATLINSGNFEYLLSKGCAFLPAYGRYGYVSGEHWSGVNSYGDYWSSYSDEIQFAYELYFHVGGISHTSEEKRYNFSVRLVRDAEPLAEKIDNLEKDTNPKIDHFSKFDTEEDYEANKNTLILPHVSLVGGKTKYNNIEFGCFLHKDGKIDNNPSPDVVGLCVIPSSHYGKARFMSLVKMNDGNPLQWYNGSGNGPYVPSKGYPEKYYGMDLENNDLTTKKCNLDDYSDIFLPTDEKHGHYITRVYDIKFPSSWDKKAKYFSDGNDDTFKFIQSPFLADDSLNPNYAQPDIFSEINGETNTANILVSGTNTHPAAKVCNDYNPGVGKWYLPAIGELAYLSVRYGAINLILEELGEIGCIADIIMYNDMLWSSTAYNYQRIFSIDMNYGSVGGDMKPSYHYVFAFCSF